MIFKGEFTNVVNFMTLEAGVLVLGGGQISHIVKIHYFLENLLLYSQTRQTNYLVMMTKKESS